jgi:uncharacterized protein YjdB
VDTGNVTADAAGAAVITASFSGYAATATVTVSGAHVQGLTLLPATLSLASGQSQQLGLTAMLDDGSTREVAGRATWTSSDPAVALVTSGAGRAGVVVAGASGSATVTAAYQGRTAALAVIVP